VAVLDSLEASADWSPFTMVAVHYDALSSEERAFLIQDFTRRTGRPVLLLLSERSAEQDFVKLFGAHVLTNMIVINERGVDISDLLVTVQKIRQADIFGLEKYFVWGIVPVCMDLVSSAQKARALDAVCGFAKDIGVPSRLRALICTMADEFITNAVYNAPTDLDGRPRHASTSRLETVELAQNERIRLCYCSDGRRFGISVTDPFGSLDPRRLQDYLARAYRREHDQVNETEGGAGLGFYEILDAASHLVVNIEPGRKTEMIGLIDVSGGFKNFTRAGKSFNIFVKEVSP
jgi:hypothetical protein